MGRVCLLFLVMAVGYSEDSEAQEGILLPPPPLTLVPPDPPPRQKQGNDEQQEPKGRQEAQLSSSNSGTREALVNEAMQARNLDFGLELQVGLPYPITRRPHSSYVMDPTVGIHTFWRFDSTLATDTAQLFYGARLQSFTGTGFYKGHPVRFGFLFYGPMVGVGKVSQAAASSGDVAVRQKPMLDQSLVRHGYLLSTGLSGVSRLVRVEPDQELPDQTFGSKETYERPGVWLEARYIGVHFGAVSVSVSGGAQFAAKKTFLYGGIGAGAWL